MNDLDMKILETLCRFPAVSGDEDGIISYISQLISPVVSHLERDRIGNLIARFGLSDRLVILAHTDEIGFMISGMNEDGTLRFQPIGGISPEILPAKRVLVGKDLVRGVICARPVHLKKDSDQNISFDDLSIRVEDPKKARIGDVVVFDSPFLTNNDAIFAKAADNRLGCFLAIKLILENKIQHGTVVFSVQEENGLSGASAFLEENSFPVGIALDTTTSNDLPGVKGADCVTCLGKGAVLSLMDGRTVYDRNLILSLIKKISESNLPVQTKSKRTGGNESGAIQCCKFAGNPVSISIPCRYIHAPLAMFRTQDLMDTYCALVVAIEHLGGGSC